MHLFVIGTAFFRKVKRWQSNRLLKVNRFYRNQKPVRHNQDYLVIKITCRVVGQGFQGSTLIDGNFHIEENKVDVIVVIPLFCLNGLLYPATLQVWMIVPNLGYGIRLHRTNRLQLYFLISLMGDLVLNQVRFIKWRS